jgi:hypothetical protein
MSARIRDHIRSNVVGYIALFMATTGVSYAASIGSADIQRNAVLSKHIKAGNVKSSDVATNAIASSKVADNSLRGTDIDESTLDNSVLQKRVASSCSSGQAIRVVNQDGTVACEGGGGPPSGPAGGDLTGTYPDPTVGANAVGTNEVDSSLTATNIADTGTLGTLEIAEGNLFNDNSLTDADIDQSTFSTTPSGTAGGDLSGTYPSPQIASGAIVNADINSAAAIAHSKLAAMAPGQLLIGNATSVPTSLAMSGDATMSSAGALTIAANAVGSAEVADDSLVSADIDNDGLRQVDLGAAFDGTINWGTVPAQGCLSVSLPLTSVVPGELVFMVPTDGGYPPGLVVQTGISIVNDAAQITACNVTGADIDPVSEGYRFMTVNP